MDESLDVRPSPAKRLVVGGIATLMIVSLFVFLYLLWTTEPGSPVCDHVAEIAKTNPREAELFVDAMAVYVMGHVVRQYNNGMQRSIDIEGDTDKRCRKAMSTLDHVDMADKVKDCLERAPNARAVRNCLPD